MGTIEERREVRVSGEGADFAFEVEPDRGRLVIRQEGADDEVCSLEVAWSREGEQRLPAGYRSGRTPSELARELGRSERAAVMRLQRLGEGVDAG